MIDPDLLALLRCPETHQPLALAPADVLARAGLDAGLLREDGAVLYPIRDGIAVLLAEEAIRLR